MMNEPKVVRTDGQAQETDIRHAFTWLSTVKASREGRAGDALLRRGLNLIWRSGRGGR